MVWMRLVFVREHGRRRRAERFRGRRGGTVSDWSVAARNPSAGLPARGRDLPCRGRSPEPHPLPRHRPRSPRRRDPVHACRLTPGPPRASLVQVFAGLATRTGRDWKWRAYVAQTGSLLPCRRRVAGQGVGDPFALETSTPSGLPTRDTADWQSALRVSAASARTRTWPAAFLVPTSHAVVLS